MNHQDIASLQLAAVIQTATDGIIIIDQLGIILKVNNAASELFGYHIDLFVSAVQIGLVYLNKYLL